MSDWLEVMALRLRAFGSGRPVSDFRRRVAYMPDRSVRPMLRTRSLEEMRAARRSAALT